MQLTHAKRQQPNVINLHLEFIRRTSIGRGVFTVTDVKLGSRISNLRLTLSQKEEKNADYVDEVEGYVTISNLSNEDGPSFDTEYRILPPPLPVSMEDLRQNRDQNYVTRGKEPFADFRRAGQNVKMCLVRPTKRPAHFPKAMVDQWVQLTPLRDDKKAGKWTNDALGFVVDIFPQLVELYVNPELEMSVLESSLTDGQIRSLKDAMGGQRKLWYPTLLLNLDVKKLLPPTGVDWLFVRVQAKQIARGRFDLSIEVLDESGDLVALSTHSSLVVDSSRNTSRKKKEKL